MNYRVGSLSYADYLKLESQKRVINNLKKIEYEISRETRDIIASNEQLARENIHAIEASTDHIVQELSSIRGGIEELTSIFQWGFTELLIEVGHLKDELNALIKIAKTPAQTWAYNQFDIARDAYDKQLYPEALECLERAINGLGDNPGYKLEYRFHYLQGLIRLGSLKNYDPEILDLLKAENSFINAARYAKQDYPKEAARAHLSAGWAAYCQNKLGAARDYTRQAFTLNSELGEAFFQAAKIEMHLKKPHHALPFLQKAVEIDRNYTLKALDDDDFKEYESRVTQLFKDLNKEAQERAKKYIELAQNAFLDVENWHITDGHEAKKAKSKLEEAVSNLKSNKYYGALDAENFANESISYSKRAVIIKKEYLENTIKKLIEKSQKLLMDNHSLINQYTSEQTKTIKQSLDKEINNKPLNYNDFFEKIKDLDLINDELIEIIKTAKQRNESRENAKRTASGVFGFIYGVIVGAVATFLILFIPGVIAFMITEHTKYYSTVSDIIGSIWLIGTITGGIIGAKGRFQK